MQRIRVRRANSLLAAALLAAHVMLGSSRVSIADNDGAAFRDLATGSDFRVRVAAALALGKSKNKNARFALERALRDAHPAVRSAAAAALGQLGDPLALPALRGASQREKIVGVKNQMDQVVTRLSAHAKKGKPKYLVSVGKLDNKSGVSGASLLGALRESTRERMAQVPGVEVLDDGADVGAASKSRNLPAFALDGSITQLKKKQATGSIAYAARVEYLIRKMPDHTLKGTMMGAAQATADTAQVRGPAELTQLQLDAVAGAVDGALRGAGKALEAATR
jgi:hypothetical protein